MNDNDKAYYLSRAEQEDEAAREAVNPLAANIHRTLGRRYRAKAGSPITGLPSALENADDRQKISV